MELGEIVDFIVDYNRRYEKAQETEKKETTRKAKQADWDSFWG